MGCGGLKMHEHDLHARSGDKNDSKMAVRGSRLLTYVVLALITVGCLVGYSARWWTPRSVTLDATVVSIDGWAGTVCLSFIHPRSGDAMEVSAELSPECRVSIRGEEKSIDAISTGDHVKMSAQVYRTGRIEVTGLVARRVADANGRNRTLPSTVAATGP
jgi:hypothetical protein